MWLMAIKAVLFISRSKLKKVTVTTFLISLCREKRISYRCVLIKIVSMSFPVLQSFTPLNFLTANMFFMKEIFQIWTISQINMSYKCMKNSILRNKSNLCSSIKLCMLLIKKFTCLEVWQYHKIHPFLH